MLSAIPVAIIVIVMARTRALVRFVFADGDAMLFVSDARDLRADIRGLRRAAGDADFDGYARTRVIGQHHGRIAAVVLVSDLVTSENLAIAFHSLASPNWTGYRHCAVIYPG